MSSNSPGGNQTVDLPALELADYIQNSALRPVPLPDEYFYCSLPLCVIDAVFSIGVTYTSTRNTLIRFCERQGWQRSSAPGVTRSNGEHSIPEFLALFDGLSPDEMADELFGNRQRTSTQSGILKAEAVRRFARALDEAGIEDFAHLTTDRLRNARDLVRDIPGQGSGISFDYFAMLAGNDDLVKPDRMVIRYIEKALPDAPFAVAPERARSLLQIAAFELARRGQDWSPRTLDHAIWKTESTLAQGL